MTSITTRAGKGSLLTNAEVDANFTNLNNDKIETAEKGAANGVATLDAGGKLTSTQLPDITITDTYPVASEAAMLALTCQRGDIAVRSDINRSFILKGNNPSLLADWQELLTPTDTVLSVAGKTGVVTLNKTDVGLANVDNTSDANKPVSTATQTALDAKANLSGASFTGPVFGSAQATQGIATFRAKSAGPRIALEKTNGSLNQKLWDMEASEDGILHFRAVNDADDAASDFITVFRTGTSINNVAFPNGNLGIGAAPVAGKRLLVRSDAAGESAVLMLDNGAGGTSVNSASIEFANGGVVKASISAATLNDDYLVFRTGNNTEGMRLDGNRNLLIGTTTGPAYGSKLCVNGGIETVNSQQFNVAPGNTNAYEIVNRSSGGFKFYPTGSTLGMTIDAGGTTTINNSLYVKNGTGVFSGSFGALRFAPGKIGGTAYAGMYGPVLLYNAYYDGAWKSIGGGTAAAITIDEGMFAFSSSQSVSAADSALTWTDRLVVDTNGNLLVGQTSSTAGRVQVGGFNDAAFVSSTGIGVAGNSHFQNGLAVATAGGNLLVGADAASSYFDGKTNIQGRLHVRNNNGSDTTAYFWNQHTSGIRNLINFGVGGSYTGVGNIHTDGTVLTFDNAHIRFPVTQAASTDPNVLDDYEEGTFTPTVFGASAAGTATYTGQDGKYTKIGNVVHFKLQVAISAHTGSGTLKVGGLPFVAETSSPWAGCSVLSKDLAYSGTLRGLVQGGANAILFVQEAPNTASTEVQMDTAFVLEVTGHYYV